MASINIRINAVVYQESGMWVAHCLEYSFVSCAEKLEDLPNELLNQVRDQIDADLAAGQKPFYGFKRAPKKYWVMFEAAKAVSRPLKPRKTLAMHWRELVNRARISAELFPITA
jgi:hypothetical protein